MGMLSLISREVKPYGRPKEATHSWGAQPHSARSCAHPVTPILLQCSPVQTGCILGQGQLSRRTLAPFVT